MNVALAATLVAAVLIGLALGALGGGGSILTVPVLVYLAGFTPSAAIAGSLVVVGVTALSAMAAHSRQGRVDWRSGSLFAAVGVLGAYGGARLSAYLPPALLLGAFALLMVVVAALMLRPRRPSAAGHPAGRAGMLRVGLIGTAVGVTTGLLGAGGGFLIVPALLLVGLDMSVAVGTSLLVIAANCAAGLAGHLGHVDIDWALTLGVTALAVAGSVAGARLVRHLDPDRLRRAFGAVVAVIGTAVLTAQFIH